MDCHFGVIVENTNFLLENVGGGAYINTFSNLLFKLDESMKLSEW